MFVIPTINCPDEDCVKGRLKTVQEIGTPLMQFDVADGALTDGWVTWNEPDTLMVDDASFEAHLMVQRPQDIAEAWLAAGATRIIFQFESDYDLGALERFTREYDAELMVSLAPETPLTALAQLPGIGEVQLLGVEPGRSGQSFKRETLTRARELLAQFPDVMLEIDGGVTLPVAREARELGVWGVAVGSYIFGGDDPREAYETLYGTSD